jgi:hypothetical protein
MLSFIEGYPNVDVTILYVLGAATLAFALYRYHRQHS